MTVRVRWCIADYLSATSCKYMIKHKIIHFISSILQFIRFYSYILAILMFYNQVWIYITLSIYLQFSSSALNQAPAKVTLRLQVSKLNQASVNESRLKLCVDKRNESCFWTLNEELLWEDDQYKEISYNFFIDNMAADLKLDITIDHAGKKLYFPRKSINLVNFNSKRTFEIHSYNLESIITVTIEYECENGYYPPRQCTKECYPIPNESECDDFGNKICKNGLLFDAEMDKCIANNCIKSNIRCQNGRCINKASTFECICLQSYLGKFCQFRNPCYPNPCSNGGKCIANLNNATFTCVCSPEFTGSQCLLEIKNKFICPENIKCIYSKNGVLELCISNEIRDKKDTENENLNIKVLESKKVEEWKPISLMTTIIVAVGCIMILLCIGVSLYVFYHTQDRSNNKRDNQTNNSPSTLYTDFPQKSNETSFKRSLSLDNNSAYMPANSQLLQIFPNSFTMGSSTAYSLNTNSYLDNPQSSLLNFPVCGGLMQQQELPATPMLFHQNYPKESCNSIISGGSLPKPPVLPPRPNNMEETPKDPLLKI